MQPEHRTNTGSASDLELLQPGGLFDPTERLLDPLSGVDQFGHNPDDGRVRASMAELRWIPLFCAYTRRDSGKGDIRHELPAVP